MTSDELGGKRFDQILLDEPIRKALYQNDITLNNFHEHEEELKKLFPGDREYLAFIDSYFTNRGILSYREFLREPQRFDLFLHPRYIQQSPHIHDFYEIKYLVSGSGTVHVGQDLFFLKESDICLIAPYVPHSSEVYSDEATMINLVIPPEHLNALFPRIMDFPNDLRLWFSPEFSLQASHCCMICKTEGDSEIRQAVTSMLAFFSGEESSRSLAGIRKAEAALEQVFLRILELKAEKAENRLEYKPADNAALSSLLSFLRTHLCDASLDKAAAFLHFSAPYTSRYIKKQTGYTFQMILLILRMEEAAKLLRETDWPVEQIARSVGLSGKTNFYRQFKSFYGVNPAVFRLEAKKGAAP